MSPHNSKTGIEVGVPIAVAVVLLAVIAFFVFQNRRQKKSLLHLQRAGAGDALQGGGVELDAKDNTHQYVAELDQPHVELTHPDAPRHELGENNI